MISSFLFTELKYFLNSYNFTRGIKCYYFYCCRTKQSVQAMEICRRSRTSVYDMNSNTSGMMSNVVPSSNGNFTVTFNNQINALHSQVANVLLPQLFIHATDGSLVECFIYIYMKSCKLKYDSLTARDIII